MHDLIIIGAGPAGLSAGLYAGRYRLNTLILEKVCAGGRILASEFIENYPGFAEGIATSQLMSQLEQQVKRLGVPIELEEVSEVDCLSKTVKAQGKTYQAKAIIIASGSAERRLGVPGEDELLGKGVSYCATCDGPLYKDKRVLVVGGGNAALEEALYLSRFAASVGLIHRRSELRACKILQEKIREDKKIDLILNSAVVRIGGGNKVESVTINNKDTRQERIIECDGVFIYVGNKPNTGFLKGEVKTDERGFIITDEEMRTSRGGVFACGDCRKKTLYQVINACAEGALASDSAQRYLLNQ